MLVLFVFRGFFFGVSFLHDVLPQHWISNLRCAIFILYAVALVLPAQKRLFNRPNSKDNFMEIYNTECQLTAHFVILEMPSTLSLKIPVVISYTAGL